MNRKSKYSDMERYNATIIKQRARYRARTGCNRYQRRPWTAQEDNLVLQHEIPDRELSYLINRSLSAIQQRRYVLSK